VDTPSARGPVLLFDDECAFCSSAVRMVLRHDPRGSLCFAALRGRWAGELRERHPELANIDSLVWYRPATESAPEVIRVRSQAAILTAEYLGGWFRLATMGRILPRWIRDRAYDLIAQHRHELSRSNARCFIPRPEERERFLP